MKGIGIVAVVYKPDCHILCLLAGAAEDYRVYIGLRVGKTLKHLVFVLRVNHVVVVAYIFSGCVLPADEYLDRIVHVFPCN